MYRLFRLAIVITLLAMPLQAWDGFGHMVVAAVAYLLPLFYFAYSLRFGEVAPANPWNATGLEWTVPSTPPKHNFDEIPVITQDAHSYQNPGEEVEHVVI